MLLVARDEVNTIDTIPELTGDFNRRWRAHLTVAGALDGLGRREMAKQERDAAAEEFVAAGYRRSEEAQRDQSRNLQIVGDANRRPAIRPARLRRMTEALSFSASLWPTETTPTRNVIFRRASTR